MNGSGGTRPEDRLDRWTARADGPLLTLSVAFLAVFVVPLYAAGLPGAVRGAFAVVNIAIWAVFAVDYLARLRLARDRWRFVRGHVPDLLVLIAPFLRPLRLLRLVGLFGTTTRRAGGRAQVRTTAGIVAAVAVLVVVCGGLVLDAERDHDGANITTAGDALWWASTTVTTVGYGDRFPTTGEGRLVGVLLMLLGIALLGVLTASIAAWFVKRFTSVEEIERTVQAENDETLRLLADVVVRLDRLERRLEERG
jgi:voltage-gated potassium channel